MKVIILLLPQAYEPKLLVEVRGSKYAQNDYACALKTVSDILPFFWAAATQRLDSNIMQKITKYADNLSASSILFCGLNPKACSPLLVACSLLVAGSV